MQRIIEALSTGVLAVLRGLVTLGRTLKTRAVDVLAYLDWTGTGTGPTEAVNGRLGYLLGSALGFRYQTHDTAEALLEAGGFGPRRDPAF